MTTIKKLAVQEKNMLKVKVLEEAAIIEGYVVISDLQLGYIDMPSFAEKKMLQKLSWIKQKSKLNKLIINGDIKHEFGRPELQQYQKVRTFFRELEKIFKEIIVIKGNHDTYLQSILNTYDIKDYFETTNYFITHGHKTYKTNKIVVIGHEHPALHLKDEVGKVHKYKCHLVGEKTIITPAFTPLTIGTEVNKNWKPMSKMITETQTLKPVINKLIFPPLKEL